MKYSELVESKASEIAIREHLADGKATAITFRIPKNLKESAQEEARNRGMSFSAFVRMSLIAELTKEL